MMRSFIVGAVVLGMVGVNGLKLNGWMKYQKADSNGKMKITLPVRQSNLDLVEKLFWEVSNPKSTLFGKYLSFDQIGNLTKNDHAADSAVQYLQALGVPEQDIHVDAHRVYVSAHIPISTANAAFNADFHVYEHPELRGVQIIKSETADLPEFLKEHVTHVPHVSYFPQVHRRIRISPELASNNADSTATTGYVTPSTLFKYYGIDKVQVTHGATQSLFEALGQQFDNGDLNQFQKEFGVTVKDITDIVGKDNPSACSEAYGAQNCGEANLDVQYIMGVAQGAETTYWSIDSSSSDPFLDWAQALAGTANVPQVHSISYGGYEDSDSSSDAMSVFNTEVQKLGLRGVTVVVSSGDDGVAGNAARSDLQYCGYSASFPASSPYVTAVGATQGPETGKPEVVCSSKTGGVITSGGGFSSVFPRPSYQSAKVSEYFKSVASAPISGYNANGRGYPDVSVLGYNYVVTIGGQFTLESGTSASAPVFAGMITLINDARLAEGKPALGFLNQALYSMESSFWNDVTSGDNKCTANAANCCAQGFEAAKGWDPVSGLGTPIFQSLKNALVAL